MHALENYLGGMMVAPGPVVRLPFLRVVAATPLPVAGEHHRVGVRLYSHSATTNDDDDDARLTRLQRVLGRLRTCNTPRGRDGKRREYLGHYYAIL